MAGFFLVRLCSRSALSRTYPGKSRRLLSRISRRTHLNRAFARFFNSPALTAAPQLRKNTVTLYVFANSLTKTNMVAVNAFGGKASIKKCLVIQDPARVARRCFLGHEAGIFNKVNYQCNVGYKNQINKFIFTSPQQSPLRRCI